MKRRLSFTFAFLLIAFFAYPQNNKSTMDLLTSTIWTISEPEYGDYKMIIFSDSTVTLKTYCNPEDSHKLHVASCRKYYLMRDDNRSLDITNVGKERNGDFVMVFNEKKGFASYRIKMISEEKLQIAPWTLMGKEEQLHPLWDCRPFGEK